MNEDIIEICGTIDNINIKLEDILTCVKQVSDINSSFPKMGELMGALEEEYSKFISINSVISKFKKVNQIVKDEFLDDFDNIFRDLNVGCEEVFGDCLSVLNGVSNISSTNQSVTVLNNDIQKLGE